MTSPAVPVAVPSAIEEITAGWLTDALPGSATVTSVQAERIAEDTGFSARLYRLGLNGDAGLPASVIVKLPAESEARGGMELLGGYRRELAFYRHIAPAAPISTPACHIARIDGDTFVLVLEDLRDWDNADHLAGLSVERAELCIAALADLHAWSVHNPHAVGLPDFPNIDNPLTRDLFLPAFTPGWQLYLEKTSQSVPPAVARFAERFAELAPQALNALSGRTMLLHGDIRADNLFFRGDELKIVDFQLAVRGAGAADIAYLVSQGVPTSVRRGKDEALVRGYVAALESRGVTDYGFSEAWRDYRFGVALLLFMPVVALLTWDVVPERSRQLCVSLIDRAVAAIEDVAALEEFS
ncbi:phosphotransferase [Mycobacterium frederiksbergense]|uniref:ecdysteroid 22-kinase family protein n=1 Tax=Mycolicibacterium frederiksbergense TaxID=117567 RepID=UPI0021F29F9A|nr:ecdysteroid 22-kinase family protein [Mycolicibacterium frederiksbergense]MCV7046611.1 phosphotransferase [Mycolicibacterium frederiksbergense]